MSDAAALGRRRRAARRLEQALASLARGDERDGARLLRRLDPADLVAVPALLRYAFAALGCGEHARAREAARRAAESDPREPRAHLLHGLALRRAGRLADALAAFDRALALRPGWPDAVVDRALTLEDLGRYEQAAEAALDGLAGAPDDPDLLNVAGSALLALGEPERALGPYRRLVEIEQGAAWARWNLACALLAAGRFREGLELYEARLALRPEDAFAGGTAPRLEPGEPVAGRRVLVWHEQGLGDTLMACRFLRLLAGQGAELVVRVPAPLVRLLAGRPEVRAVVTPADPLPDHDRQVPFMSLPRLVDPDLDRAASLVPYLSAEPREDLVPRAARAVRLAVGVAWAGRAGHAEDRWRSMPASALAPLAGRPDLALCSLQTGERAGELHGERVFDLAPRLDDLAVTAGVLRALDAVVTVDSALAHLAGALGCRVLVLLPRAAEWRWGPAGERSRWYPTATLVRQRRPGAWDDVVARVAERLAAIGSRERGRR